MKLRWSRGTIKIGWNRGMLLVTLLAIGSVVLIAPPPASAAGVPILPDGYTAPPDSSSGDGSTTDTSNTTTTNTVTDTNTSNTDVVPDPKVVFFSNNPGNTPSPLAPEPATLLTGLFGAGVVGWITYRKRRRASMCPTS